MDWRTPAAEPLFAATLADPRGLAYRRRFRWSKGRIVDYWDEVFGDEDEVSTHVSPDDLLAFVSSLSEARTGRMQYSATTIGAIKDQRAFIRADSRGALLVDRRVWHRQDIGGSAQGGVSAAFAVPRRPAEREPTNRRAGPTNNHCRSTQSRKVEGLSSALIAAPRMNGTGA